MTRGLMEQASQIVACVRVLGAHTNRVAQIGFCGVEIFLRRKYNTQTKLDVAVLRVFGGSVQQNRQGFFVQTLLKIFYG